MPTTPVDYRTYDSVPDRQVLRDLDRSELDKFRRLKIRSSLIIYVSKQPGTKDVVDTTHIHYHPPPPPSSSLPFPLTESVEDPHMKPNPPFESRQDVEGPADSPRVSNAGLPGGATGASNDMVVPPFASLLRVDWGRVPTGINECGTDSDGGSFVGTDTRLFDLLHDFAPDPAEDDHALDAEHPGIAENPGIAEDPSIDFPLLSLEDDTIDFGHLGIFPPIPPVAGADGGTFERRAGLAA